MKKVIIAALAVAMCASVSMAGSVSIVASNKDAQVTANGPIAFVNQPNARVGNSSAPCTNTSLVIPFLLPTLYPGSTIQSAALTVYVEATNSLFSTNTVYMDILGGRTSASATVSSNDWNYGTVIASDVAGLYKGNAVTLGSHTYTLDSAYLQNAYSNGAAGQHVFITLYADGINSAGQNSYVAFTTADGVTNANRPTLEFTTLDTVKFIETSVNSLSIAEGATNSFNVRLNLLPDAGVTVNVSRVSGGASIAVVPDPTALVFSTANWNAWQPVYVAALVDADTNNAVAQIECVDAAGVYTSKTVSATQIDTTPVAAFTAVPTAGYAPLPVTFTDTSVGGITNRFWDFGDGVTTNTTTNKVSHTYTVAGTTSTVQLTVSGPLGGSTKTMAINVPNSMNAFPLYNSFSDEVSASAIPAGWACFAPGSNVAHSSIASGSLSYAGLQASAGNSWGLGEKTDDYSQDFVSPNLGTNETIYFSFLMRMNSPLNVFNSGYFHLFDRADPNGSDVSVGWGTSTTNNFTNTTTMGFSINKNAGWNVSPVKTPEMYTAADTVYLLVGSYTRGTTATNGSVRLWVNPDSATFGTATPPAATLTTNSFASDAIWNRIEFISTGSGAGVPLWQVDEMRIATSWAAVVPVYVAAAPVITSALTATGTVNQAFTYQITADNSPSGFDAIGLPSGLSINTNNGAITGTPSAAGSNDVTISASNMIGTDSQTLVLIIKQAAPVITSALLATGTVDQAFSYQITADNNPDRFDAAGLPAGLSINTNNGAITGTPSAAGSNNVTLSASNAGGTGSKTLVVVISSAEVVTDIDNDGLPNDWETLYFGGATNANPAAICANGINTVIEAYIAGLNPTNPASVFRAAGTPPSVLSWNSASGRVYSVYWTTNLMNGLQCIVSNLPWTQNSFTNPAPAASSFYKIDVRLE
jgi:PKD repeat protein